MMRSDMVRGVVATFFRGCFFKDTDAVSDAGLPIVSLEDTLEDVAKKSGRDSINIYDVWKIRSDLVELLASRTGGEPLRRFCVMVNHIDAKSTVGQVANMFVELLSDDDFPVPT